jgi:hypothetical protein
LQKGYDNLRVSRLVATPADQPVEETTKEVV